MCIDKISCVLIVLVLIWQLLTVVFGHHLCNKQIVLVLVAFGALSWANTKRQQQQQQQTHQLSEEQQREFVYTPTKSGQFYALPFGVSLTAVAAAAAGA